MCRGLLLLKSFFGTYFSLKRKVSGFISLPPCSVLVIYMLAYVILENCHGRNLGRASRFLSTYLLKGTVDESTLIGQVSVH